MLEIKNLDVMVYYKFSCVLQNMKIKSLEAEIERLRRQLDLVKPKLSKYTQMHTSCIPWRYLTLHSSLTV